MVTPIDLPVLFSQLPHLQHLQHQAQNGPQGSQNILADVVVQKQEEAKNKIFQTEKAKAQSKVSPDKEKDSAHTPNFTSSQKEKKSKLPELKDKGQIIDLQV
ncbi:MAG TPA: hypothetical protein DIT19_02950 [Desulfonauticus sp.]|jgi:hypothetical protein|nr:MAG: hypothetical protein XD41_1826 [Desulfonauticus sp. 38_4375]MDK2921148.1 hypothetical protein [Desulfonauticus sp.]HCO12165.1 hypothetical protein [Desulfonauticus sp.]